MNNNFQNLINEVKKIALTAEEKAQIFNVLDNYAVTPQPARPVKSPWFIFTHPASATLAAVLILVLVGGSTVFASQGSLPGDLLYPIKTKVAEPLKVALAPTPEAKDRVRVAQVEERLKEAEDLAVQGRLATTTATAIKETVAAEVESFDDKLSDQNRGDFETRLETHAAILKSLKEKVGEDQKDNVEDIEKAAKKHKEDSGKRQKKTEISEERALELRKPKR